MDPTYGGPGEKYRMRNVASAPMLPVAGITWREAALYCNWLHNGKQSDPNSLKGGAYDTSTFGGVPFNFTDALTHETGAKYWIPTLDEAMKSQCYDPNRFGTGQGGWCQYKNTSDEGGISGPPGSGTTSSGYTETNAGEWDIPLGAYPDSLSPWDFLDTSGGSGEWIEEVFYAPNPADRGVYGSWAGDGGFPLSDHASIVRGGDPGRPYSRFGLRIASTVPGPSSLVLVAFAAVRCARRSAR
ncbi:MAG: SUMF1/EgtB/PvdO family nonheme iron enzyme [Phycisphaerales bacterium]|nr:SUMF1/EgtB/PvdO family nonheme iron enzyme [Phycisphaerales bacterium]